MEILASAFIVFVLAWLLHRLLHLVHSAGVSQGTRQAEGPWAGHHAYREQRRAWLNEEPVVVGRVIYCNIEGASPRKEGE